MPSVDTMNRSISFSHTLSLSHSTHTPSSLTHSVSCLSLHSYSTSVLWVTPYPETLCSGLHVHWKGNSNSFTSILCLNTQKPEHEVYLMRRAFSFLHITSMFTPHTEALLPGIHTESETSILTPSHTLYPTDRSLNHARYRHREWDEHSHSFTYILYIVSHRQKKPYNEVYALKRAGFSCPGWQPGGRGWGLYVSSRSRSLLKHQGNTSMTHCSRGSGMGSVGFITLTPETSRQHISNDKSLQRLVKAVSILAAPCSQMATLLPPNFKRPQLPFGLMQFWNWHQSKDPWLHFLLVTITQNAQTDTLLPFSQSRSHMSTACVVACRSVGWTDWALQTGEGECQRWPTSGVVFVALSVSL